MKAEKHTADFALCIEN